MSLITYDKCNFEGTVEIPAGAQILMTNCYLKDVRFVEIDPLVKLIEQHAPKE